MKKLLYFMVGLVMLPVIAFNKIAEVGDIAVSNYKFWKSWNKNLK